MAAKLGTTETSVNIPLGQQCFVLIKEITKGKETGRARIEERKQGSKKGAEENGGNRFSYSTQVKISFTLNSHFLNIIIIVLAILFLAIAH